ncbi:xylulokinase [Candidatus Gottesmanbacteria bacterium RIFCSPLOWO2_01_FULL_46_9]|uniref:Xylulose kinase n=1 Tax=Candidatus Gottesmanbacteria bacterium RIFCSPLOWO2_01_FULL_46_9 TaxID=1798394 RepID=A0A1F6B0P6_9BACT|nr:MAG: xylulokinase [Candidatus Gottesmanbacteria bacterium RIFCSPLOWO2_01_FULL_46_9]
MNVYVGLDLGTTMLKGIAMDDNGKILASYAKESPMVSRLPSWAEQSPELWWSTTLEILNLLGTKADLKMVKGIGISGQMHGLVAYDNKKTPLRRAIVWMDKRSSKEVEEILSKVGNISMYKITGNPIFTGFLLSSLLWIKRHEPDVYKQITQVSSPKDYVAYRLTGELKTEPTDALATGVFDYQKEIWSAKILKPLGISLDIFPPVIPTTQSYGGVTPRISKITGIPAGTPVFGGSDQSMAALGNGLVSKGDVAIAISTGGQFLVIGQKGHMDPKRRLHTLNHALPGVGLYMAATLSAGFSLKWFKNEVTGYRDMPYPKFLEAISHVPPGADGLFYLPYLAGERTPYFNPKLRGAFIGLSHAHTRAHLVRAIIEGVAFSMKDCLTVFEDMKMPMGRVILSGGGVKDPIWRQVITDVIDKQTETINVQDHSPFGAAILAKFAQEGFDGLPEFYKQTIQTVDYIYPNEKNVKIYEELFKTYKKHALYLNTLNSPKR